jgi:hypothetical protein
MRSLAIEPAAREGALPDFRGDQTEQRETDKGAEDW